MKQLIFVLVFARAVAAGAAEPRANEKMAYGELASQIVARLDLWPDLAPHETTRESGSFAFDADKGVWRPRQVDSPDVILLKPRKVLHDTLLLAIPSGAYVSQNLGSFCRNIRPILESGRWVAVLHHRIPARPGRKPYEAAREDGARAVRVLRANAEKFGYSKDRIGAIGFSAGGHLAALLAASSRDRVYDPVDAIDKQPTALKFAVPVFPAYVTDDKVKVNPEFKFDMKTPPMFLVHGDEDPYSPMGSALIYAELHRRKIPAQLFIYAHAAHGLNDKPHVRGWQWRVIEWLDEMGY